MINHLTLKNDTVKSLTLKTLQTGQKPAHFWIICNFIGFLLEMSISIEY